MKKETLTLAIDTSCDETSAAVVEGLTILSSIQPSQMEFHSKYGGVVPSLAKLAHEERIDGVIIEALKRAGKGFEDLDFIAVTYGPGLAMALEVGIKKAKVIAREYEKPLIIVNHMEGHLLSSFAKRKVNKLSKKQDNFNLSKSNYDKLEVPSLGLLVSGGHTEMLLVNKVGEYKKIGQTLDDACGECYDKCGRMLGLGYPAGPVVSEFAKQNRKNIKLTFFKLNDRNLVKGVNIKTKEEYTLPVSMINSKDLNFSYSGLKTAFKQLIEKIEEKKTLSKQNILDLCVVFEAASIRPLSVKLEKAIIEYSPKEVLLGGGVVASAKLRSDLRNVCRKYNINLRFPFSKKLTGDNAAMIGIAANFKLTQKEIVESFKTYTKTKDEKLEKNLKQFQIFVKDFSEIDRKPSLSL